MTDEATTAGGLVEVRMPKVGHGGLGAVRSWNVAEGDDVKAGDLLADVELEKASVEVESPVAGRVIKLLVAVDEEVETGTVIAHIESSTS